MEAEGSNRGGRQRRETVGKNSERGKSYECETGGERCLRRERWRDKGWEKE